MSDWDLSGPLSDISESIDRATIELKRIADALEKQSIDEEDEREKRVFRSLGVAQRRETGASRASESSTKPRIRAVWLRTHTPLDVAICPACDTALSKRGWCSRCRFFVDVSEENKYYRTTSEQLKEAKK